MPYRSVGTVTVVCYEMRGDAGKFASLETRIPYQNQTTTSDTDTSTNEQDSTKSSQRKDFKTLNKDGGCATRRGRRWVPVGDAQVSAQGETCNPWLNKRKAHSRSDGSRRWHMRAALCGRDGH